MSDGELFPSMTDEQRMLRDTLASFFRDRDGQPRGSEEHWIALTRDLGMGRLMLSEAAGGVGGGPVEAALLMHEAGYAGLTDPILDTIVMGAALERVGAAEDASDLMRDLAAGAARLAWAWTEHSGRYEPAAISTRAERMETGYLIRGEKIAVFGAEQASQLLVVARTGGPDGDRDGLSLFRVNPASPGISTHGYRAIDGSPLADLCFEAVAVPANALIGLEGAAWPILEEARAWGVAGVCAEMGGVLRRMIDLTVDHVRQREQFGRPLAQFQALRHHLVDAWALAEQAHSMAGHAAGACRLTG